MLARILQQQQQSLRNLKTQIIPHRQMSSKFIFHFIFPARSTMSHVPYVPLPLTVRSADFHTRGSHGLTRIPATTKNIYAHVIRSICTHTSLCDICICVVCHNQCVCIAYLYAIRVFVFIAKKTHTKKKILRIDNNN